MERLMERARRRRDFEDLFLALLLKGPGVGGGGMAAARGRRFKSDRGNFGGAL